jgi:hypothetical protein
LAPTTPVGVPASLIAGTTWKWTDSPGDFPTSDGWALEYRISGPAYLAAAATVVGNDYSVTITDEASSALPPGLYQWRAFASKAGEVYPVANGTIEVVANPSAAGDTRTFAAKQLEKVEAEIAARFNTGSTKLGSAHEDYTIDGRSLTKISMNDLQLMRARLSAEVARERAGGGMLPPFEAAFGTVSASPRDQWRQRGGL